MNYNPYLSSFLFSKQYYETVLALPDRSLKVVLLKIFLLVETVKLPLYTNKINLSKILFPMFLLLKHYGATTSTNNLKKVHTLD